MASDVLAPATSMTCRVVDDSDVGDDRRTIARAGIFTMGGAAYAGAAGFVLTLVVGHLFGAHGAGVFFMAVSIFTILNGIAVLGADTGLLRIVATRRSLHAHADARSAVWLTAAPVLAWSTLISVALWMVSGPIARNLAPTDTDLLQTYLRVVAVTLVLSAFGQSCLVASRGLDDLRPYILLYQVGLSTARIIGIAAVGLLAAEPTLLLVAWVVPLLIMDVLVIGWLVRQNAAENSACPVAVPGQPVAGLFSEIWRFNVPRGLASFCETGIVWADVIIVGWFLGPAMAGAYAAASRFITTGTMAMEAMRVGSAPTIAAAYARNDRDRAKDAYQVSSIWLVLLSWPVFLTLASFAPFILGLIGPDFTTAASAMSVMSLGILGYLLLGNINTVLLMAGRSSITATNSLVTLVFNIGLNLVLIPMWGLVGAAVAWSLALILDSTLCVVRGHRHTGATPPLRSLIVAATCCLASFGLTGVLARLVGDQSLGWLLAHLAVGSIGFALLLRRWREPLRLRDLRTMAGQR